MVTGVYPARHGIWNNNAFGPTDSNGNNNYFYEDIKVKPNASLHPPPRPTSDQLRIFEGENNIRCGR